MASLMNKERALVIGAGVSGRGATQLLLKKGYEVIVIDRTPQEIEGATFYLEGTPVEADLVVLSSGVSRSHPQAKGKVIGEAELAFQTLKNRMIGITGTNGKTTVTLLVTHLLNACGIKSRAVGNVGLSLAGYAVDPDPEEVLVVELSSFQLETLMTPSLDVALITNITPDHLDRYPSFEAYQETKLHIGKLVKEGGIFFDHRDSYLHLTKSHRYWDEIGSANVLSAWKICDWLGIKLEAFNSALATFKKPAHRMEFVRRYQGITFINDSKGTNVESVL